MIATVRLCAEDAKPFAGAARRLTASAILLAIGGFAKPASATTCGSPYCGGVVTNNSSGFAYVANNWCWADKTRYWGNTLPCANSWNAYGTNSYFLLAHSDSTVNYSYYYDTDAFRVDARCKMTTWDGTYDVYDNSTSNTPMWVKISNLQRISIVVACW